MMLIFKTKKKTYPQLPFTVFDSEIWTKTFKLHSTTSTTSFKNRMLCGKRRCRRRRRIRWTRDTASSSLSWFHLHTKHHTPIVLERSTHFFKNIFSYSIVFFILLLERTIKIEWFERCGSLEIYNTPAKSSVPVETPIKKCVKN